ncbi:MAG: cellulase family glycosylhydrolase [Ruminococcus flavefaciens]|nr:cellulase family glycosylhydrolase [Ruminococcus flavefaciens]MCM1062428.1 cellulase family glycosylhydrolase [Eubacterium sp.]
MNKKIMAFTAAFAMLASCVGCSSKKNSSSNAPAPTTQTENTTTHPDTTDAKTTTAEPTTEEVTEHISPVETLSSTLGSQVTVNKTIQRTEGSNTVQLPLADFIEEGDVISSFTFVVYSADGSDIGEFKGGCGISVTSECSSATDEGWYQSADFSAATQGTYGEIKWDVPADVSNYISAGGDVLFGYWWGNAESIRVDSVICTYTRTREIPVDGTVSQNVGKSCSYETNSNTINIPTADFLPEGAVPEAVTYNISTSGPFGKFTGAFGYNSSSGYYQSGDISVFTDSSSLSLTWFVPAQAKNHVSDDGELVLGYWWSEQPNVTLDSVAVKYRLGGGNASTPTDKDISKPSTPTASTGDFRSANEIVSEINVGWNLGNTLDSYNTSKTGIATETGWGNPKTTKEMIQSVKNAGFNAIRIPITWGEHMNGDTIDSEWLERAAEIVDYAYNEGLFVIINMHHDDYIWFEPTDSEYSADSAKLKAIWGQIAARFADYGDRLIFEGMNEPRTVGSTDEWMGGTSPERAVINKYEQDFVDTVRKSGGNNAERSLIITSYAASAETSAINDVVVPNNGNIIVSIHYYAPWQFSDGTSTVFDEAGKSELDAKFAELKKKFADKGTPVIIGEFGCVNAAPENVRTDYYNYYIKSAMSQGIKCFIWDNGISTGDQSFGIFNRSSLSWNEAILKAITDATK